MDHLYVRIVEPKDWKAIQAIWIDQAKSRYAQYIKPRPLDNLSVFKEVQHWVEMEDSLEQIHLVVCSPKTVIGHLSFFRRENGSEIGYFFHSAHRGKEYVKESIKYILGIMKENGESHVITHTALKNTPSVKMLLSLGYKQTGTKQVSFYKDNEGKDIYFDEGIFELDLKETNY